MSVADLMHDDHLVIHSDFPLAGTRGRLQGQGGPGGAGGGWDDGITPVADLQRKHAWPSDPQQRRSSLGEEAEGAQTLLQPAFFKSLRRRAFARGNSTSGEPRPFFVV